MDGEPPGTNFVYGDRAGPAVDPIGEGIIGAMNDACAFEPRTGPACTSTVSGACPSRKTVAPIGMVSPSAAAAGRRPQATWGQISTMGIRSVRPSVGSPFAARPAADRPDDFAVLAGAGFLDRCAMVTSVVVPLEAFRRNAIGYGKEISGD